LDALVAVGVKTVVVNVQYLAEMIIHHLKTRSDLKIIISQETELLETGGGVKKAINYFDDEAFFVLNSDVLWTDGIEGSALKGLAEVWDDHQMDALLMMYDVDKLPNRNGVGDYVMGHKGALKRGARGAENPRHVFTGPRIVHPRLFKNSPQGAFSFLTLFDQAEDQNRLFGYHHQGQWYHCGTPEELAETNDLLAQKDQKIS